MSKGTHWANKCKFIYDVQRNPIQGNGHLGPAPAPPNNRGTNYQYFSGPAAQCAVVASSGLPVRGFATGESCKPTIQLCCSAPGSATLDLSPTAQYVLTPEMGPQVIPTGAWGPIPPGTVSLILGRSNLTIKGFQVLPGAIDEDYTGEIKVMVQAV